MDDTWQVKCGSALQSSVPSVASSASQEVELSSGKRFLYPSHVGKELRSQVRAKLSTDSMTTNISGFSSHSMGHGEVGNSFQALLSGSASLLHGDFQEFSNPKLFNPLYKRPSEFGGSSASKTIETRIPNISHQSVQNGLNFCASNASIGSGLQHGFPAASINLHRSGMAMADILPVVSGNRSIKDYTLSRGECCNTISGSSVNLQKINMPLPQKMSLEAEVPKHSSPLSGCPRVFCMGISGGLLLSNTGLLGILCSCHCFHMSVSKFCEHSGLRNVNAGDAVRMDSGETIAQWRKIYFQRFGIRVPEDQNGWDWPEGLSLTASLVKFGASLPVSASNKSKKPDLNHDTEPSGVSERLRQPPDDNFLLKKPVANQNSDESHNRQERNGQDSDKFLINGLLGTFQSNSCGARNNKLVRSPSARCSTMPEFAVQGPEIGSQSLPANVHGIVKTGTVPTFHPTLQNLGISVKSSDVNRPVKAKDGFDKDPASSNIELRLGQPYHQSMSAGNPVLSLIGPWVHSRLVDSQTPFSAEQTHKVTMCKQEEARQNLPQFAGLFDCTTRSKEHLEQHLHYRNCSINPTMDSSNQEIAGMSKNPVVSLCKQFYTSPDGCTPPNVTNSNQQVLPETISCESHIVKGNSIDIPRNASNSLGRHPDLSFINSIDKGKPVGCNACSYCSETVSLSKLHNCWENPSSFTGFVSQNGHSEFASIHDNGWLHFSSVQDVSDAGKFSHCNEKVSCVGSSGLGKHVILKSMASAIASSQILPPQPVRTGLLSPCTELTPALFKQESICSSPYLLDDNLRLIALRQILELSKQQQVMSRSGKNLEQWKCSNFSDANLIHTVIEPSKSGEQRLDSKVTRREGLCEFSTRSIQAYPFGSNTIQDYPFSSNTSNDLHPCPSVSGIHNHCDPSQSGTPFNYKENALQHQLPRDPHTVKQPSLILSRNGKGIASANEHGNCCHRTFYIQGTCGCVAHTKCLGDKCNLRNENSPNLLREPIGSICGEASSLVASQFVKDCTVLKETAASSDKCRKPNSDIGKSISCHASKWKDVPSKVKSICDTNKSTVVMGGRRDELAQLGDTAAKCPSGTMKVADFLGEKEMSNVSSGRSAPAVTQASVVSKNIEFSTALVGNTVCINDNIVDEGSGIDKCWSSDDALESDPSADFYGSTCKTSLRTERSFEGSNNQPSRTLLDEVKLMNSLTWRKGQHQIHNSTAGDGKTGLSEESEMGMKTGKKRETKLRILDASLSNEGPISCDNTAKRPCLSKDEPSSKRGKSKSSSVKPLPRKRDLHRLYHETDREDDHKNETNDAPTPNQTLGIPSSKKFRSTVVSDGCTQFQTQQKVKTIGEDAVNFNLMGCTKTDCHQVNLHCRKARPIVCGKYGEIANGKPARIVSLDKVLKNAKRCILPKKGKPRLSIWREGKRTNFRWSDACFDKFSNVKKTKENRDNDASGSADMNHHTSAKERTKASSSEDKLFGDESLLLEDQMDVIGGKDNTHAHSQSKPKIKEIRKRSLHELTLKGKNSELCCDKKNLKNTAEREFKISFKSDEEAGESCKNNAKRCDKDKKHQSVEDSFSFCCVCGSSNEDEINCLLECGQCLIKIHQACYGVSKVPKGLWYCRPCRTSSTDIACVLCGYGGGAMTLALRSQTIVKSLLKAWSLEEESWPKNASSCAETIHDKLNMVHSSGSGLKNNAYSVANSVVDPSTAAVWNVNMQNQMDTMLISLSSISNLKVHNSITAGVRDSTVKQWVHMVCGLWTPGTRCPNVDTMSAFDVSGASCPRASVICSICNRPGGSCIQCRVVNCSVQFHPWCAHQKGLLQSEVEGIDNENVGFYGRCILHATYPTNNTSDNAASTRKECSGQREESCARTEGYKGRKRDGFWYNPNQLKGKQCLVPQEQLNAWIHINGQKSSIQGLPKLPVSDMEYDCRKEYNRYKQAKGWKRLVVYKSGIHALGLYTSQFISRGEMVVEYVGEIVGLRVADKRENEYQSGRKLQYKSACYFFRIDTEHIIDATCKGGIARFVNHSCLPNCVAKVISVRNEKKVVFFAERDIYPGEEITYDYHFNHEDEGKKIPCFCNSKNCRRYLN